MKTNLRKITGNWELGFVLDKHTIKSVPTGYNEFGHMQFDTTRTEVGEALFQLKNRKDWSQVEPLSEALHTSVFPLFKDVGLIIPVPASKVRKKQPVFELASSLANRVALTSFEGIVQKAPAKDGAPQLKDLNTKAEKVEALAGRFSINDQINGDGKWNVLVVDDLYHTGASVEAVCEALATYTKIDKIYVAALSWR